MKIVDSADCNKAFGLFLREARKKAGLSQAELASAVGLTQSYFSRIESGERSVDLAIMINLFRFLGLGINTFFAPYFADDE